MPLDEKNYCFSPSLTGKLFLFALSLLSFVNKQYLRAKRDFLMKEGPKNKVISRIYLGF
jgi:hypothetical protein